MDDFCLAHELENEVMHKYEFGEGIGDGLRTKEPVTKTEHDLKKGAGAGVVSQACAESDEQRHI